MVTPSAMPMVGSKLESPINLQSLTKIFSLKCRLEVMNLIIDALESIKVLSQVCHSIHQKLDLLQGQGVVSVPYTISNKFIKVSLHSLTQTACSVVHERLLVQSTGCDTCTRWIIVTLLVVVTLFECNQMHAFVAYSLQVESAVNEIRY